MALCAQATQVALIQLQVGSEATRHDVVAMRRWSTVALHARRIAMKDGSTHTPPFGGEVERINALVARTHHGPGRYWWLLMEESLMLK